MIGALLSVIFTRIAPHHIVMMGVLAALSVFGVLSADEALADRFSDFLRVGIPMNLFVGAMTLTVLMLGWSLTVN